MIDAETYVAVLELTNRFGYVFDKQLWGDLPRIFTEDATFDLSAFGLPVSHGLPDIRAFVDKMPADIVHHASNLLVEEVGSEELELVSKYLNVSAAGRVAMGQYQDLATRTAAGWRLQRRRIVPSIAIGGPTP